MAGRSIKPFSFIQQLYRAEGIQPPQSNQIRATFNRENVIFFLCLIQSGVAAMAFLLFDAKFVIDLGMCIFYLACLFLGLALYLTIIWQMGNISKFIENCEAFIATSKPAMKFVTINRELYIVLLIGSNATVAYKKTSERIEMFCKWICIAFLSSLAFCSCSTLIFSIVNYFIFNLAEESFYLIFLTV